MLSLVLLLSTCVLTVWSHGRLMDPPARSSAWRVIPAFRQCCTEYTDHQMFCGGVDRQYKRNNGKCGICGEPFDQTPKLFEKGGSMYRGEIVRTYNRGQQIDVKVDLTVNHAGYFQFRLCNVDSNPNNDATQDCLDRRILQLANSGSNKYPISFQMGTTLMTIRLQLPADVSCNHCVFQWKYTAGNSWGTNTNSGTSGLGQGTENETFMGCADIGILGANQPATPPVVVVSSTTPSATRPSGSGSEVVRSWQVGVAYNVDDRVTFEGKTYRCIQAHTAFAANWTPAASPSLWQ